MADADIDGEAIPASVSPYRPSKRITEDIRQHCHIFLDEQLYMSALILLNDLVTNGASHPCCETWPAIAPVPFHIEVVSALIIHPRWTTQALPNEHLDLSARSLTFLRNVLSILGPLNANLGEVFSFSRPDTSTNRPTRRGRNTLESDDGITGSDEDGAESMRGVIANKGRLRRCARDFWHVVGWLFNCSVKYPKRWQYWKVWLEYMLDVLDADYEERERIDKAEQAADLNESDADFNPKLLLDCLLIQYLSDVKGNSNAVKRVVRAVFADGGSESLREFSEVYQDETREPKYENGQKRSRSGTLLDNRFGDYDDEDSFALTSPEPESSQDDDEGDIQSTDPYLGGTDSIALRQRVLALLSKVAVNNPQYLLDCTEFYDIIYFCTKPLPLPAFSLLLSPPRTSKSSTMILISLTQFLLLRLLPNAAPAPSKVPRRNSDELSQEVLEICFLPFSASTSSTNDNAKVSILVENLLRVYMRSCRCYHTPNIDEAIETGIKAREKKVAGDKRNRGSPAIQKQEQSDRLWLDRSSLSLRSLLALIEKKSAEEDYD